MAARSGKALVQRAGPSGCTCADIMREFKCTMREAIGLLKALERRGWAARSGGGRGEAFRWRWIGAGSVPRR
jgi:DNA-binding IclR family transcriptional regulator